MDDLALAAAVARKDQAAIRLLFDRYFDGIYRFLRQLTGHRDDAEDLAQQALIRAIGSANRYDGRAPLRSWLYAIALREYGRWRRRRLWLPLSAELRANHDVAEVATNGALLLEALSQLTPAHRATFLLHHVEGLSIEEIASVQGVPVGTVKSRLHFARARLRGFLEQEEFYVTEPSRT